MCLGTMTFARESDEATSAKLLDRYLEAGGNFIDTADVYADTRSEEVLGRLLRGRRDEVVLVTKGHFATGSGVNHRGSSRVHLTSAIEASLRRLQTDRIDLYSCTPGTPTRRSRRPSPPSTTSSTRARRATWGSRTSPAGRWPRPPGCSATTAGRRSSPSSPSTR
jgi:aryl-alcohol dehydrogenase-like predicted oxidoreductase